MGCGGIYGWPKIDKKYKTWMLMRQLKNKTTLPLLMFGDFNEILHETEKDGGCPHKERKMDKFREAVDFCRLKDLGAPDDFFFLTWQRGTEEGKIIRERLDHFLGNEDWCDFFPNPRVSHVPRNRSDHCAIMLETKHK